jgi:hypothetical protein
VVGGIFAMVGWQVRAEKKAEKEFLKLNPFYAEILQKAEAQ